MVNFRKSELQCQLCSKILKDPVNLPCQCTICHGHLKDGSVKDGLIECVPCGEKFVVKGIQLKVSKYAKLESEGSLSPVEKAAKSKTQKLHNEFQQLYDKLQQEQTEFELSSYDHFAEIKRRIDLQREELKEKIDEIYLAMIRQVEKHQAIYKQKLDETRCFKEFNAERETKNFEEEFRKMDLTIENVQKLQTTYEAKIKALQDRMTNLQLVGEKMRKCSFMAKKDFGLSSFGALTLRSLNMYLASSSGDEKIILRDFETKEYIRTLEGHAEAINCIEVLENGQLVSGSADRSLKVWNPSDGVCLKTIVFTESLFSLKALSGNRVACGSEMQIQIWNMNDETCIRTLEGHTGPILCQIVLPDETLASSSVDKTIKLWNLSNGMCVKTLCGHTEMVSSLLLLKNGHLASGSDDTTIKIWNVDSGECIRTLHGHTNTVWGLESTEIHELISCSVDKLIKIWNTTSGECIRTLTGHDDGVFRLKVFANDTLFSSSVEIIKIWDLTSGECTHTLDGHHKLVTGLCFV